MKATRKPKPSFRAAISLALLAALLVAGLAQADPLSIETWDEGEQNLVVTSTNQTNSNIITTTASLGGQRDLLLQWVSGTGGSIYCNVDFGSGSEPPGSNRLSYNAGDFMRGQATLQWDGIDNSMNVAYDGLGNVDLTDGGASDSVHVVILAEDLRAVLRFEVYEYNTAGASWCYSTVNLVGINPGTRADVVIPFSSFLRGGGTGLCSFFNHVGAVVMFLDGTIDQGLDVSIDFAQTDSAREYGDLPALYGDSILNACHIPQGMRLGYNVDAEMHNNASTLADGDNNDQSNDEDGVTRSDPQLWAPGTDGGTVLLTVQGCTPSQRCYVSGWIDWDRNGDFSGTNEQILNNKQFQGNSADVAESFTIPAGTSFDNVRYYARFRICPAANTCNQPDTTQNNIVNGEIEDYAWDWAPTAVKLTSFDATWQADRFLVAWETASEHDNVGFNLYRSTSVGSLGVQLNDALIPSQAPGGDGGASYQFVDTAVQPSQTYYYTLEDVDLNGTRTPHGPVRAVAGYVIFLPLVAR
jgi:hypothetical protein